MNNVVVICIYNRKENLSHWLHCWAQCSQNAQLVIIHNSDGETYNVPTGVIYIKRRNIGFDIGAFQDVCKNRLPGFPAWDNLLWVTDDTFPMLKDFTSPFFTQLAVRRIGVVCMEISREVRQHIRTTGFALSREVAARLQFPVDPIKTKEHCYDFEHRHRLLTLFDQVSRMRLSIKMVAPQQSSPLWDSGYHKRLKREDEHYKLFGAGKLKIIKSTVTPKIVFICPIYKGYPQIVSSLICQTYKNWELHLIHDGPGKVDLPKDERIIYTETEIHAGNWGHSIRSGWLQKVTGDYVVITNPDNYYAPVFIEYMLKGFHNGTVATYCSDMVHSYKAWEVIPCSLKRGYIDCGGVMLRLDVAKEIGWKDITSHSADWFFFERIIKEKGIHSFNKIKGCLLIHN